MLLTRSEVARRLGRSVATVRKMEASGRLSPRLGLRRIRIFDADQVDRVAGEVVRSGRALRQGAVFRSVEAASARTTDVPKRENRAAVQCAKMGGRDALESLRCEVFDVVQELVPAVSRNPIALDALERLVAAIR
jgi:hypothetical protein